MLYPNRIQAAMLFDHPLDCLEAAVRDFARVEEMKSGTTFNVPETNPGRFYRLFNGDEELMLTFEYIEGPALEQAFRGALSSPVVGMLTPDIRDRIANTRSHILLEVSHGVLGGVENDPRIASFLETIGRESDGATQEQFHRRLDVLVLMSRVMTDHAKPLAVHWTQSDMLVDGDTFDQMAAIEAPGPLHIHPFLFGPRRSNDEASMAGIRTYGARHWLGREILIQPSVLPWSANFETILAFLRIATMQDGYVIPDGDTFGPEDRSTSTRVTYRAAGETEGDLKAEEGGVPLYELTPLKHTQFDFVDPDHVPDENVIDDRNLSGVSMPEDQDAKMEEVNRWRESRKMAEAIGGTFEVRAIGENGEAPPSTPAAAPQIICPDPEPSGIAQHVRKGSAREGIWPQGSLASKRLFNAARSSYHAIGPA